MDKFTSESNLKSKESFSPIDESGNELQSVKCNFDQQGSCSIKIKDSGYYGNWNNKESYTPKILFHKGDKKVEVNERLIKALLNEVSTLSIKVSNTLKDVVQKRDAFQNEIETPFLSETKLAITISSISQQIEELELRLKDCERLANLVS